MNMTEVDDMMIKKTLFNRINKLSKQTSFNKKKAGPLIIPRSAQVQNE